MYEFLECWHEIVVHCGLITPDVSVRFINVVISYADHGYLPQGCLVYMPERRYIMTGYICTIYIYNICMCVYVYYATSRIGTRHKCIIVRLLCEQIHCYLLLIYIYILSCLCVGKNVLYCFCYFYGRSDVSKKYSAP